MQHFKHKVDLKKDGIRHTSFLLR